MLQTITKIEAVKALNNGAPLIVCHTTDKFQIKTDKVYRVRSTTAYKLIDELKLHATLINSYLPVTKYTLEK